MKTISVRIDSLTLDPANLRKHGPDQLERLGASLARFGQQRPVLVDAQGVVRAGNGTVLAARALGWEKIHVVRSDLTGTELVAYAIADNRLAELAEWDDVGLAETLRALQSEDFDLAAVGFSDPEVDALIEGLGSDLLAAAGEADPAADGPAPAASTSPAAGPGPAAPRDPEGPPGPAVGPERRPSLFDRFIIPPSSILDARQGYWQDRKRAWIAAGVAEPLGSTAGRDGGLTGGTILDGSWRRENSLRGNCVHSNGTSIFDPVLAELAYRWFAPPGGSILDPFAGGAVRGIVAARLGYRYTGVDLRPEQIEANRAHAAALGLDAPPAWIPGDSRDIGALAPGSYDLVFSCPPYAYLERYSDDPADLSTLGYEAFLPAYRRIIAQAVGMLRPDRFAAFVVGDLRDKGGFYHGLVGDTIAAFEAAGARLYNHAILAVVAGSLPIRVGRQFGGYRKLGESHQDVLVFYKGDPGTIPANLGEVEVSDPAAAFGEVAAAGAGAGDEEACHDAAA